MGKVRVIIETTPTIANRSAPLTFRWILEWAANNPGSFIYTVLLILSPFFIVSAYLSWKLAKHLEADQKKKKAKQRRLDNIKAARAGDKNDGGSDSSSKRNAGGHRAKRD